MQASFHKYNLPSQGVSVQWSFICDSVMITSSSFKPKVRKHEHWIHLRQKFLAQNDFALHPARHTKDGQDTLLEEGHIINQNAALAGPRLN